MSDRRRLRVPEVIQTSAMDCGPAALDSLLAGFGVFVHYGRLREACRTTVDGTSIDALEDVAKRLGLDATQTVLPVDHLLETREPPLPAIVVVRRPGDRPHFVVAWSRHAGRVQVMDPAVGRQWIRERDFLASLFVHSVAVSSADWRSWAGSPGFLEPLRHRLRRLGVSSEVMIERALADKSWRSLARLDAATRMTTGVVKACGVDRGRQAERLLGLLVDRSAVEDARTAWERPTIPRLFWSVRPTHRAEVDDGGGLGGDGLVHVRGAVVLSVRGRARAPEATNTHEAGSVELQRALTATRQAPLRELARLLGADRVSRRTVGMVAAALLLSAGGLVAEAILFRSVVDLGRDLGLPGQRLGALGAMLVFTGLLLVLDVALMSAALWLGRRLEARLRLAFLSKLPRLRDDYLQSRPSSDMAERCHNVHRVRMFPSTMVDFCRTVVELLFTTLAIAWLAPRWWRWAALASTASVALPLAFQVHLSELDLRVRTQAGGLSRFYLDAMLGLTAIRSHSAERSVRREHESLLAEWARASRQLFKRTTAVETVSALVGFALVGGLFVDYISDTGVTPRAVLLLYWVITVPSLGRQIAYFARTYLLQRSVTLRLLEPLGAPEDASPSGAPETAREASDAALEPETAPPTPAPSRGAAVRLEDVRVLVGGHTVLDRISVEIAAGEHAAIVGPSGAGKSTLVSLLLGWHRPATGTVRIDGRLLDESLLRELRQEIAWIDPGVQLWNRSVLDNVLYGSAQESGKPGFIPGVSAAIRDADLGHLLKNMPDGLQTLLGEGGMLASGGEGQRVRIARALTQRPPRLVILDEPFRGLDRAQRQKLMALVRARFADATLLCITHDVADTLDFPRVLVVEMGQIAEDSAPRALLARAGSRFRALYETEQAVKDQIWSAAAWRKVRIERGQVVES